MQFSFQYGQHQQKADEQLIETIMLNPHFQEIASILSTIQFRIKKPLLNVEPAIINYFIERTNEAKTKKQKLQICNAHLKKIIEAAKKKQAHLKEQSQILQQDLKFILQNIQDIRQQKQLIDHQNEKLLQQKQKQKVVRSQKQQQQLNFLLLKYRCQGKFPKNKTQTLILLNKIEAKIQQLQLKKALQ